MLHFKKIQSTCKTNQFPLVINLFAFSIIPPLLSNLGSRLRNDRDDTLVVRVRCECEHDKQFCADVVARRVRSNG